MTACQMGRPTTRLMCHKSSDRAGKNASILEETLIAKVCECSASLTFKLKVAIRRWSRWNHRRQLEETKEILKENLLGDHASKHPFSKISYADYLS